MNLDEDRIIDALHRQTWISREAIAELLAEQARIARWRGFKLSSPDPADIVTQARTEVHELCGLSRRPFAPVVTVLLGAAFYRNQVGLLDDDTADTYVSALLDAIVVNRAARGFGAFIPSHTLATAAA